MTECFKRSNCCTDAKPLVMKVSLGGALLLYCMRDCANPRDKVFGLRACVRPNQRISADYTLTAEDVFIIVLDVVESWQPFPSLKRTLFPRLCRAMGLAPWDWKRLEI
jgi:hypothetical protein